MDTQNFSCAPNNFKASYSKCQVYLVCGDLAVEVSKSKLNKTLKEADLVEGFTWKEKPNYIWITNIKSK